jgi:hypothetical protein
MDRPADSVALDMLLNNGAGQPSPHAGVWQALLADADVVYAVEGDGERNILVFGREKLQEIADSDVPQGARVLRVNVGSGPHQLQQLLALVGQSKGYHDYHESA